MNENLKIAGVVLGAILGIWGMMLVLPWLVTITAVSYNAADEWFCARKGLIATEQPFNCKSK